MLWDQRPLSLQRPMSSHILSTLFPGRHAAKERRASHRSAEERALGGDIAAWNELARLHNRSVILALLARGLAPESARDIAQDTWARLIEQRALGRLERISMPGLAIRQALFFAADMRRARVEEPQSLLNAKSDSANDPWPRLLAREQLSKARHCLRTCSATERDVFRALYASPGKSAQEASILLGLSVQRVRQIHCELRKKIRHALSESHTRSESHTQKESENA